MFNRKYIFKQWVLHGFTVLHCHLSFPATYLFGLFFGETGSFTSFSRPMGHMGILLVSPGWKPWVLARSRSSPSSAPSDCSASPAWDASHGYCGRYPKWWPCWRRGEGGTRSFQVSNEKKGPWFFRGFVGNRQLPSYIRIIHKPL